MALKGRPLVVPRVMVMCEEAKAALRYAIIGIFCLGPLFGVMAMVKGSAARKSMAQDPLLVGSGMATTGVVIGTIDVLFWIYGIATKAGAG